MDKEIFTFISRSEAEKTFHVWAAWLAAAASRRSLSFHGKHAPRAQCLVVGLLPGMSALFVLVHVMQFMLGWQKRVNFAANQVVSLEQHLCQAPACTGETSISASHQPAPELALTCRMFWKRE